MVLRKRFARLGVAVVLVTGAVFMPPAATAMVPEGDRIKHDIGFDPDTGTITLGVLASISGPIPEIGQAVLDGHRVFWERVNAEGGINGMYPVELVVRDNGFDLGQHIAAYEDIKDEVAAISSTLSTGFTAAIVEDAAANQLTVNAGSLASRWALVGNVTLDLGAGTYFTQFANGPYWAMAIADPPVITDANVVGIIHQADDYGQDCKNGYDLAQDHLGFSAGYEATHEATDTDLTAQIVGAQTAGVDVLFVCTLPTALASMLATAATIGYSPTILGSSPSYNVVLPIAFGGGNEAAGVAFFNSFPYYNLGTAAPWESNVPGMVQMRQDLTDFGPGVANVDAFFYFGYTQGQTFDAILSTAFDRGDVTRSGILKAIDKTRDVDLGLGMGVVGYGPNPKKRIPTTVDSVGIIAVRDQRLFGFEPVSDFLSAPYLEKWNPAQEQE